MALADENKLWDQLSSLTGVLNQQDLQDWFGRFCDGLTVCVDHQPHGKNLTVKKSSGLFKRKLRGAYFIENDGGKVLFKPNLSQRII